MSTYAQSTPQEEPAVLAPGYSYGSVTDQVAGIPLERPGAGWLGLLGLALAGTVLLTAAIYAVIAWAVGIWGINIPVAWGFAIINFVWWIGIGHAGTLISAILLLLRQTWRNSINRLAEAMTLFAVANAALFPLLHLGRIWKFYYLLPYPNSLAMWPQWRSPLVWDVFAVLTYFTVSLVFWYVGLIPDLATLRDKAQKLWAKRLSGVFALGWRHSARHWHHYQMLYLLLAGLATPLVVSVHSIVSLDFSVSIVPGWHSTIFPPYFVAGAIFSGFAMVLTIALPLRAVFKLHGLITRRHLDNMAKVMLVSGLIVSYGYLMELFIPWYSGEQAEIAMVLNRTLGPYAWVYWATIACNTVAPQALWFSRVRVSPVALFIVSQFVNFGMWAERFMIIIVSLHRDYIPSAWGMYYPTFWDYATLAGTVGLFVLLTLLFIRFLPVIPIFEIRELIYHQTPASGAEPQPQPAPQEPQPNAEREAAEHVPDEKLYGLAAQFDTPQQLLDAARQARDAGYTRMDAYTPLPLHGLAEAMGLRRSRVPLVVLLGAIAGAGGAYLMQWYAAVIDYPWNIGGRPYHAWPSFVPLTFELGVLGGALAGLVGMFVLNRLPQLHHPIFNAPEFDRASRDRFFLCLEKADPRFRRDEAQQFLQRLKPRSVSAVPD